MHLQCTICNLCIDVLEMFTMQGPRATARGEGTSRQTRSRTTAPLSSPRGRGGRGSSGGATEEVPRRSSRLHTYEGMSRKRQREDEGTEELESSGGDGDDSASDENFRVEPSWPVPGSDGASSDSE